MPGSYRSIGQILPKTPAQNAKQEELDCLDSEDHQSGDSRDCQDGKWALQQNLKFALFVHYHEAIFASKRKRKLCKIFKTLSEYLATRSPTQCRSHFQKMIAKHKSVTRLKKYFKGLFGTQSYLQQLADFKLNWEENHQPLTLIYPELKETKEVAIQTDEPQQEPALCTSCTNREGPSNSIPPLHAQQQMNPLLFWFNVNQPAGLYPQNFLGWMPSGNQFGGPRS